MALTLIKSGIEPNKTADQEEHVFTYSLYPHENYWRANTTVQEAYKLNQKAYFADGALQTSGKSFVSVDKDNVIIETVKHSECDDGIIIRMYECDNSLTNAKLTFDMNEISSVIECNLMEEEESNLAFDNNSFKFTIKPYEVKTYKVKFK